MPSVSSPFLSFSELMSYGMEYPFGQFRPAVPVVFPPRILPTPSLLIGEGMLRHTVGAVPVLLSSSQNPGVAAKTNTFLGTNAKHSSSSARPNTVWRKQEFFWVCLCFKTCNLYLLKIKSQWHICFGSA